MIIPAEVLNELTKMTSYDDTSGKAAQGVLGRRSTFEIRAVELDETFLNQHPKRILF